MDLGGVGARRYRRRHRGGRTRSTGLPGPSPGWGHRGDTGAGGTRGAEVTGASPRLGEGSGHGGNGPVTGAGGGARSTDVPAASPGLGHEGDTGAGGDSGHGDNAVSTGEGTSGYRDIGGVPGTGGNRRRPGGGTVPPPIPVPAAWQRPYLNIFKHFRVEEWKRSAREGDVAALTVTGAPAPRGRGGGHRLQVGSADTPPAPQSPLSVVSEGCEAEGNRLPDPGLCPHQQLPAAAPDGDAVAGAGRALPLPALQAHAPQALRRPPGRRHRGT